jgi:hypothetical protein
MYYKKFDFLIQYMKITNNEKLFEKIEWKYFLVLTFYFLFK